MAQYQIFVQYQYCQEFCFQNQYQYQNSSNNFFNIKININIKIFLPQYKNQYQNFSKPRINIKININIVKILIMILKIKFFGALKIYFNLFWHMPLGTHGIPPTNTHSPQTWNLRTLFKIKGTQSETLCIPLWTPLAQNYYLDNSMKSWDPPRNLLHLSNDLGDSE